MVAFLVAILLTFGVLSTGGCDGTTSVSFQPPIPVANVSLSFDSDGVCTCGAGLWTPVGMFSINHTFSGDSKYSYVIIRNRERGTDQVFKLARAESLEIDAVGEHKLILKPQRDNKWIVETETRSGTLTFKVHYAGAEIARVDFGEDNPVISVMSDRRLVYKYPGFFTRRHEIPIDSIQDIAYSRDLFTRELRVNWKTGIQQAKLKLALKKAPEIEAALPQLQASIQQLDITVPCRTETHYLWSVGKTILVLGAVGLVLLIAGAAKK